MKNKLFKQFVPLLTIITIFSSSSNVLAITNGTGSNISNISFGKEDCVEEENDIIVNNAMYKIENDIDLSDEDIAAINQEYENLSLSLPQDIYEDNSISNVGIMSRGAVVGTSLIRGAKTTVQTVGSIPNKLYDNGKGGRYNFSSNAVSRFTIPGLLKTTAGTSQCSDMVPQGICVYNGYIFMSAYCYTKGHSSVVYVLDASSKKYITTLITGNTAHAGGIEILNGYLWIGHTDSKGHGRLYYYNASQIIDAVEFARTDTTVTAVDMTKLSNGRVQLDPYTKASYITKYNGYLCVGEYYESDKVGRLNLYTTANLLKGNTTEITIGTVLENTNGVLFFNVGDSKYMIVNASYGNSASSYVHVYSLSSSGSSALKTTYIKSIELPCMIEEAMIYGSYMYFVFESGAKAYKNLSGIESVIGRVCGYYTSFIYK